MKKRELSSACWMPVHNLPATLRFPSSRKISSPRRLYHGRAKRCSARSSPRARERSAWLYEMKAS